MRALLGAIGNPQSQFPSAHLAGTKGKGSTAAMLAAIVHAAGYRVGCYLSPHVNRIEERISVAGKQISSPDLLTAFRRVIPAVEKLDKIASRKKMTGPTWFEVLTAIAFAHFERAQVDLAVIETGLGGRLDATNLCNPVVSIITNISLDHTDVLGNTIRAIATEKAGIIRRGIPVVSTAMHPDALHVIIDKAQSQRTKLLLLKRDFAINKSRTQNQAVPVKRLYIPLRLRHRQVHKVRSTKLQWQAYTKQKMPRQQSWPQKYFLKKDLRSTSRQSPLAFGRLVFLLV